MKRVTRRALLPGLLLGSALLAGCGLFASPKPEPPARQISPVQEFMISRTPGGPESTGVVSDPEFGYNLRIVLEQEFLSATGETCRRASLFSVSGEAEVVVTCRDASGTWVMVPRVWGKGLPPVTQQEKNRSVAPQQPVPQQSKPAKAPAKSNTEETKQPAPDQTAPQAPPEAAPGTAPQENLPAAT